MYLYCIVYVKLHQIVFQNINTSTLKYINFCYAEILWYMEMELYQNICTETNIA